MERERKKYLAYMLLENLKHYRKHRIPVYVTEIDLREPKAETTPSEWTQAEQYKLYRNLFAALVRGGCRSITAWGITDYHDNAEGEHGVFRHCMFSNTQGCKEMGPPYRKRAHYGTVSGILHARSLGSELRKDKD